MKKIISTSDAPKAIGPYSQAVEINGVLYVSGQIAIDPSTSKIIDGGIEEQTEQVLRNIGNILYAAGYDYSHVVKSTIFITEIEDFAKVNEVYSKFYKYESPARSTIQVCRLPWDALIEIETIATK